MIATQPFAIYGTIKLLRRCVCLIVITSSLLLILGCEASEPQKSKGKNMNSNTTITIDLRVFKYYARPFVDVFINQKDTGSGGGGGLITGFSMKLGPQVVSWRLGGPEGMARNGETVIAKNTPVLAPPPKGAKYLGVHIYPDETVEFIYSEFLPERTERGESIRQQQRLEKK